MLKTQKNTIGFMYEENDNQHGETLKMTYSIDPDESIWKIHELCKRFCLAMGFSESVVDNAFGETVFDD